MKGRVYMSKTESKTLLTADTRVVFVVDVSFKSTNGRITYAAKVGSTGTIKTAIAGGKKTKYVVDLDRKLSAKKASIAVEEEWVAVIQPEPIVIESPAKTESTEPSWKGHSYETLKEIAQKHNLEWRETENEKINLMWVIAALKKAEIQPPASK